LLVVSLLSLVAGCGSGTPPRAAAYLSDAVHLSEAARLAPAPAAEPCRPGEETGPVPDYAPMRAIASHRRANEFAPALPKTLDRLLGRRHWVEQLEFYEETEPSDAAAAADEACAEPEVDLSLVWMRDFQPMFVRDDDGELTMVRYLSVNPNRTGFPSPRGLAQLPQRRGSRVSRVRRMPLIHEMGNLVVAGRTLLVTDLVFEENDEWFDGLPGYRRREPEQVKRLLAASACRPTSDVVVLPRLPHEATGHIDLFVMALGDRELMVPRIEWQTIDLLHDETSLRYAWDQHLFLDAQVERLRSMGFSVHRMPMLPPVVLPEQPLEGETQDVLVFSPANALLAHVEGRRRVLLPSFPHAAFPAALQQVQRRYERRWMSDFTELGWQPVTVDASELVESQGLLRCLTASIPQ
jgi:hypothetical protein